MTQDPQTGLTSALPEATARRLEEILTRLDEADLTVALAESCTGGLASAAMAGVEGVSHVLTCGFVTYSDDAKRRVLGVPAGILEADGAVSRACAVAMAEGALKGSSADLAVSITGFAGPGGPDDEEGLVHFALAREGRATETREAHFGAIGRDAVRLSCLKCVLDLIEMSLNAGARAAA
ncbi:MAG TPA: nicotinamide-nucleotide amidohydrolase family protein [Brevundimonas sp.]|jgi:nicotinamide-nucleotide amidase|uniref:CinA family protein n=1 Tax=Brevundimonas sp. TaxID=1871086 RepID=UPI002DE69A99|nr:nicotinamide-nucleotide amidohydrolase family protein [Brevundimonas sp.]